MKQCFSPISLVLGTSQFLLCDFIRLLRFDQPALGFLQPLLCLTKVTFGINDFAPERVAFRLDFIHLLQRPFDHVYGALHLSFSRRQVEFEPRPVIFRLWARSLRSL